MLLSTRTRSLALSLAALLPLACGSGPAGGPAPADPGPADPGGGTDGGGGGGDDGSAGDADGGDPGVPPAAGAELIGRLTAALPERDRVHVLVEAAEPGVETALFASTSPDSLLDGPPAAEGVEGGLTTLTGFTPGDTLFLALGVRRPGDSAYVRSGAVLTVRLADPVLVDPASTATQPDGTTPATAFADPVAAILHAFVNGGNVWLRAGTYDVGSLPVFPGTALYGGFGAGFDPVLRGEDATVLRATASLPVVAVAADTTGAVLDGLVVDGRGLATVGVDVDKSAVQLRGVAVRDCAGRGLRLRNEDASDSLPATVVACTSSSNGGDGLSANGAFDLVVDASDFSGNVQEGLDFDDLVAPDGETVSLTVRGCRFLGNGTQGLDVDLSEPLVLGALGGRFEVEVEGSLFAGNAEEGLLVDFDFELVAGWEAEVVLRGNTTRANRGHGVRIDADAPGSITVHRHLSTANGGDGLAVTSESDAGLVVVSTSAFAGNQGAGVRASLGNRAVALTHSILAGNAAGGLVSEVLESTASSCVAWLQPAPFAGTLAVASVVESDPTRPVFLVAPELYGIATSIADGAATLDGELPASDAVIEVADDGVERAAVGATASAVVLDPAPGASSTPRSIAAFAPGSGVHEDWTVVPGSAAVAAGLAEAGGAVDAGVYGSACPGGPGFADAVRERLFALAAVVPAQATGVAADGTLTLRFRGGALDPSSVDAASVRALDGAGAPVSATLTTTADGELQLDPAGPGWGPGPLRIELGDLRAITGAPLCASVVLSVPVL